MNTALRNAAAPSDVSMTATPTIVAIGGSGAMSLQTFEPSTFTPVTAEPVPAPSASSMRRMETGLAFIAILVALLLNLGR